MNENAFTPSTVDPGQNIIKKPFNKRHVRSLAVLLAVLILPALAVSASTIFLFDAPGSGDSILTNWLAVVMGVGPFTLATSSSLLFYLTAKEDIEARKNDVKIVLALPVIHIGIIIVLFILLELFCAGQFSC